MVHTPTIVQTHVLVHHMSFSLPLSSTFKLTLFSCFPWTIVWWRWVWMCLKSDLGSSSSICKHRHLSSSVACRHDQNSHLHTMICNQEPRHYKHTFDVWFHFFFPDFLFASLFLPNDASLPNSQALSLFLRSTLCFAFLNQNSFWVLFLLWSFSKRLKDLAKSFVINWLRSISVCLFTIQFADSPFCSQQTVTHLFRFKCHFPLLTELADSQKPIALQHHITQWCECGGSQ